METPIPLPPSDYPYVVALLAGLCICLLGGFVYALKFTANLFREYITKLEVQAKEDRERSEKEKAIAAAKWDAAEQKREMGREKLLEAVAESTRELHSDIDESSGKLEVKIEAQGKALNDLVLRLQRLEDKSKKGE